MKLRTCLICGTIAFIATTSMTFAQAGKDAIMAKEKSAWQAFKDKKADDFKKVVSPDVQAVYADGMMNLQGELDAMAKTDMKSFSLSDFNVAMPDKETVVATYKATIEASVAGKDTSGNYNCGTVWTKKNGEWKAVFHSDMKATPPAAN